MNTRLELDDPQLTRDKLFSLFAEAVREKYSPTKITFSAPDELMIVSLGGETRTVFLENLWIDCRDEETEERVAAFERLLRSLDSQSDFLVRRENIVPIIRDQDYVSLFGDGASILRQQLAGDIWIVYAVDMPDAIKTLSPSKLAELEIPEEKLLTIALENLRNLLPEIERHGGGPSYLLTAGADYVSSILLLDEVWRELEEVVEGDIVAAVPSRDVLLFTGSSSREGIERVRVAAREIHQGGSHVISQTLLRRKSGHWAVFE